MRRRRLTWLLLSVMLVITAICVWRIRDRAAEKRGVSAQAGNLAKPEHPLPTASSASPALTNQSAFLEVPGPSAPSGSNDLSQFAYRLSNTTKSLKQLARSDKAILLENALVDTEQPPNLAIPDFLRAHGDPGTYIVQSRGPLTEAFRALLKQAGGSIVSYIPNNAYLVRISAGGAQQLAGVSQAVLPYEPYYKLKGSLLKTAVEQSPLPENAPLNLLLFPDAREAALAELQNMRAHIVEEERSPFGPVIKVRAPADSLAVLAGLVGVQEIELVHVRRPANDLSRVAVGVSRNTTVATNYLGLTGANILVNINDTGVDASHPDLQSKVSGDSAVSLFDTNGHGTHVA